MCPLRTALGELDLDPPLFLPRQRVPGGSGLVLAWQTPRLDRVPQGLGFLTCMCAVKVLPSHVSILSPGSMTLTELGTRYTHSLNNSWLCPLPKIVSRDCGVPVEARKLLFYLDQLFTCTSWDRGKV